MQHDVYIAVLPKIVKVIATFGSSLISGENLRALRAKLYAHSYHGSNVALGKIISTNICATVHACSVVS